MDEPMVDTSLRGGHQRLGKRPPVVNSGPQRRSLDPELAARLRAARLRSGVTIRQLALYAGFSKSMVWAVCAGQRVPCRDYAHNLIAALQLDEETAEWLLTESVVRAWPDEVE